MQVRSNIILKSAMEDTLRSVWAAHNGLAGALPVREVQIYQAGFRDALQAVGLAVGVDWQDAPTRSGRPAARLRIDASMGGD